MNIWALNSHLTGSQVGPTICMTRIMMTHQQLAKYGDNSIVKNTTTTHAHTRTTLLEGHAIPNRPTKSKVS